MAIYTAIEDIPRGKAQVILADPPWAFRTYGGASQTPTNKDFRCAETQDHYQTMGFAAMADWPIADIAHSDAVLLMWVVGSHLDEALALGKAWGFEFKTDAFCWIKTKLIDANQINLFTGDIAEAAISMGYYSRKQMELCLLFKRGKGVKICAHDVRQMITEPRREHSRKPDVQYERIERLFGDVPRLEMFARCARPGWDSFGNEVGKFEVAA